MISTASRQLVAGWMLTSITPGSGVTLITSTRGIERRRIALDMDLQLHFLGGRFHRRDQFEIILQLFDRRHEGAQHAVADFDRHRGAHAAAFELLLLHLRCGAALRRRRPS